MLRLMAKSIDRQLAEDIALIQLISLADPDISIEEQRALDRAIRTTSGNKPLTPTVRDILRSIAGRLSELTQDD